MYVAPANSQQVEEAARPEAKPSRVYLVLVACVAALGGLLFGYDTAVISGAIGFVRDHFHLSPAAVGWVASSALLGCVAGTSLVGFAGELIGRRTILRISGVFFLMSSFATAYTQSASELALARIVAGIGIGAASMASPLYIAEIAPAAWRGLLVGLNQFAIISGMLLIYFVNYCISLHGTLQWNQEVGWRWMFGSGIFPSALLLLLLFFVPETPHFLIRKGRLADAMKVLARTGGSVGKPRTGPEASPLDPPMRRVLVIGVVLAVLQQVTGINVFLYYAPQIFAQISHKTETALLQTILVGAVNLLFTVVAMAVVDRLGRKPLMIGGALGMGICLLAMGTTIMVTQPKVWLLIFVLGYIACFALSVGPVTWILLSEIFPMSVRNRALAIAATALWLANFVVSQTFPILDQNPTLVALMHHAFPFYLYAFFCVVEVVFVWRWIPETKDMLLEDIETLWAMPAEDVRGL